jgi:TetR/AcrR family fatty acid metabolism transcriptional regulator
MERGTHEAILDSATACFSQYGYKKASVDKIAAGAHVAKGTVYLYCDSKEDLLYQAVHRELREFVSDLSQLIDLRRPADQILVDMATSHLAYLQQRPLARDLLCGILDGQLPDWKPQFRELRNLGVQHVIEVLQLGIRQGVFAADLDVESTARILQEMELSGVLLADRTPLDPDTVRRLRQASLRLVLGGLQARPGPKEVR